MTFVNFDNTEMKVETIVPFLYKLLFFL